MSFGDTFEGCLQSAIAIATAISVSSSQLLGITPWHFVYHYKNTFIKETERKLKIEYFKKKLY